MTTQNRLLSGIFFLFCMIFSGYIAKAESHKIYVSPSGNDSNIGTIENPMASLNGAIKKLRILKKSGQYNSPAEIIIKQGSYFMSAPLILLPEDSGNAENPLTFKSESGERPIFYGGKKIDGFIKISNNLWQAKIPETLKYGWNFEQLYVNGIRAIRAKSPNHGLYSLKEVQETLLGNLGKDNKKRAGLSFLSLHLSPDGAGELSSFKKEDLGNAVITLYHKWDNTRKKIAGFDPDSSSVFITGQQMKPWNRLDNKTRYTLENYRAAMDTCGEWFLDHFSGNLYYIPRPGETIENTVAIAPVYPQIIIMKGDKETEKKIKNILFENISFQCFCYQLPTEGNEPNQAAYPIKAIIMADNAEHIEIKNCEVCHTGINAVWFRNNCKDCKIEHCYFHDLGAGGVKIGNYIKPSNKEKLTKNIVVNNNIIRSGGFVFPCAVGVTLFHASDCHITHNEIADFRYSGISVGWVWGYSESLSKRNDISFNHIHHLGWGELSDMGGIYCLGKSEGTTLKNNVIHHVYSFDYGGWGLYTDEGSTGIIMENNLVYNCKNSGFHQHYGEQNVLRNNIFANNIKAQLQATRIEDHLSFTFCNNIVYYSTGDLLSNNWDKIQIHSDKNCYWNTRTTDIRFGKQSFKEWQQSGKDKHSIIDDPKFVDPSNFDFKIKNKAVLRKIGFKPFDYSKAGVYGSDEWKKLSVLDPSIVKKFDKVTINK